MSLRVGIVGAGNMAEVHAQGWTAAGDSVDVVQGGTRAESFASSLGVRSTDDLDDLLGSVDVVDICTPTDTHLDYITAGAAAGVAVVCEKPLARTGADAALAAGVCAEAGVPLLVAHVLRFFPEYDAARRRVEAGDVGEVAVVRLDRSTYLPTTASEWFRDGARSGGVVLDLMIHDVDYAAWIAGRVNRVYARLAPGSSGGDHALATLKHDGGAISHVQGSWAFPKGTFRTSFEIAGSQGLIRLLPGSVIQTYERVDGDVPDVPAPPTTGASPYVTQMRHFSDVIQERATARVTPTDAVAAVAVCDAIATSIASGRAIDIEGSS